MLEKLVLNLESSLDSPILPLSFLLIINPKPTIID